MAASRTGDTGEGPADPRMVQYLSGSHHPQHALAPRVAFVAVANADVVGYVAGHLTTRYQCDGELQYLYVAPSYRRGGVATDLVRQLASWFRGQAARKVCVDVNPDSQSARPFYASLGARPLNAYWMVWDDITTLT